MIELKHSRIPFLFAIRLKKYRKKLNWSQSKLARESGLTSAAISMIEKGNRSPNLITCKLLADRFNLTIDDFIKEQDVNINIFNIKLKKSILLSAKDLDLITEIIDRLLK